MNKILAVTFAVAMGAFATVASAATSNGTLMVTGTVTSSIDLTIESAGGTTGGTGYGSGHQLARQHQQVRLGADRLPRSPAALRTGRFPSNVGVKVVKANLTSTDYTLTAQLGSAPATGIVWKLNGSTLSDTARPR